MTLLKSVCMATVELDLFDQSYLSKSLNSSVAMYACSRSFSTNIMYMYIQTHSRRKAEESSVKLQWLLLKDPHRRPVL